MKKVIYFFVFSFLIQLSFAQNKTVDNFVSIDKKALQLPESQTLSTDLISAYIQMNFKTDKEKTRAIFMWIASNIMFDIDNINTIYHNNTDSAKISRSLLTRKGICGNYAALFNDLCTKVNVKSYIIDGYTKKNGSVGKISHAWCAAQIDNSWYLFDPTWGSGYVRNGKYYMKINTVYFMAKPSALINSHMPFDYLWQFLNYPVSNQEFIAGKTGVSKTKTFFNFNDSIKAYEKLDDFSKLVSTAKRIEENGVKNSLIFSRLQYVKKNIENDIYNRMIDLYNSAVADCNEGVNSFKAYINFKNKQFIPNKTDLEIQNMFDEANGKLTKSKSKLVQMQSTDINLMFQFGQLKRTIDHNINELMQEQNWLNEYFSKGELDRKSMFVEKVTWKSKQLN
jgi:hypothetical protein